MAFGIVCDTIYQHSYGFLSHPCRCSNLKICIFGFIDMTQNNAAGNSILLPLLSCPRHTYFSHTKVVRLFCSKSAFSLDVLLYDNYHIVALSSRPHPQGFFCQPQTHNDVWLFSVCCTKYSSLHIRLSCSTFRIIDFKFRCTNNSALVMISAIITV